MSLDKAINSGKEKRKQYPENSAKSVDWSCRNHGSDSWSFEDRNYSTMKRKMEAEDKLKEVD